MPANPTPTLDLATLETAEAEARGEAASLRHTLAIIGAERAAALARAVEAERDLAGVGEEMEKWRTAASVLCGRHVGIPRPECPVCAAERLSILGPDTEVRVTVEARAIASAMMQPAIGEWRKALEKMTARAVEAERERDEARAALANIPARP